jgi:ABC-type Na+ efflux pump permease subunit
MDYSSRSAAAPIITRRVHELKTASSTMLLFLPLILLLFLALVFGPQAEPEAVSSAAVPPPPLASWPGLASRRPM